MATLQTSELLPKIGSVVSSIDKKRLIQIIFIIILIIAGYWIYNHSFIEVTIANPGKDKVTYKITDQKSKKIVELNDAPIKVKRLVSRGTSEVFVDQNGLSFFAVAKSSGFLRTKKIEATVLSEKQRTFTGNNPASCMHLAAKTFISYNCGGFYSELQIHKPATADTPTYVEKNPFPLNRLIEGVIKKPEGSLILLQPVQAEDTLHTLYTLNEDLSLGGEIGLADLGLEKTYSMLPYREGFLVYENYYNSSLEKLLYYPSASARPLSITLERPKDSEFVPNSLNINGEVIAAVYTKGLKEDTEIENPKTFKGAQTEVIVSNNGVLNHFTFKTLFSFVTPCGSNKLCTLAGKQLDVYDISGKKQKLLYSVSNVESIQNYNKTALVSRENEILELDIDKGEGFASYTLGDYSYCGIQTNNSEGYTLCLTNGRDKKVALYIDQKTNLSDPVDKRISNLLKYPEIDEVSIYGEYIFILPVVGAPVHNIATDLSSPDITILKKNSTKVREAILEQGIDQSRFKIYNPYDKIEPKASVDLEPAD